MLFGSLTAGVVVLATLANGVLTTEPLWIKRLLDTMARFTCHIGRGGVSVVKQKQM